MSNLQTKSHKKTYTSEKAFNSIYRQNFIDEFHVRKTLAKFTIFLKANGEILRRFSV